LAVPARDADFSCEANNKNHEEKAHVVPGELVASFFLDE
jgi:hypothetical protein